MTPELERALAYFRPYAGQNGPSSLRADESRRHLAVIEAALANTPLERRIVEHAIRTRCAAIADGHAAAMEGNPPTSGEAVARYIAQDIRAIDLTKPVGE